MRVALQRSGREVRPDCFQCRAEHLEVSNLPRHEKPQRVLDVRIGGELQEVLVHDLGARLGGHVRPQVDREIPVAARNAAARQGVVDGTRVAAR